MISNTNTTDRIKNIIDDLKVKIEIDFIRFLICLLNIIITNLTHNTFKKYV